MKVINISEFDVPTARQYAEEGRLEAWIHAYLNTGYWANLAFSEGLKRQPRWWRGPLEIRLPALSRCCGPEPTMEFRMEPAAWENRVASLTRTMTNDPLELPPLIVEYRQAELSIRDGNTRYAVMEQRGWPTCWAVIWYNTEADYREHDLA